MTGWTKIRLGDVLTRSTKAVIPQDTSIYKLVTVKMHNKGVVLRQEVNGSKIKSTRMFCVQSGQFILSRIDARNGAFGIIPPDLDGAFVTNDFPIFNIDKSRIDLNFLKWKVKTQDFIDICKRASEGTTNRVRLKENKFSDLTISLPPLPEQRCIVAKIEKLAAKIEEAKELRRKAVDEAEVLIDSALSQIFSQERPCGLVSNIIDSALEINRECRNPVVASPNEDFLYLDISNVESKTGRILGIKNIKGCNAPSRARRVIRINDVLFSTVRPYLKSFTIVPSSLDNQICSTGFTVFSCPKSISPKFLFYHLLSPFFMEQCEAKMRGGHYPAINDTNLKNLKLMIPDVSKQNRIAAYLDNLQAETDRLKRLQLETQSKLDALIPSILMKAFSGKL